MKTSNANKDAFMSVGIISVKCKPGCQTKLLFTPNSEHSVSVGTKKYAVFLPTCNCKCLPTCNCKCLPTCNCKCAAGVATPICGSLKSVPISVCCFDKLSELVAAATQQTAVEVEVEVAEEDGKPVWSLKSITIPAPCRKK